MGIRSCYQIASETGCPGTVVVDDIKHVGPGACWGPAAALPAMGEASHEVLISQARK